MGRRSGAARRARAAERAAKLELASRSTREVIADTLLAEHRKIEEAVRQVLNEAAAGNLRAVNAMTKLLDQAYGRPTEQAPPDVGVDDDLPPMTREQRAKIMARLEAELAEVDAEGAAGDATENWPTG